METRYNSQTLQSTLNLTSQRKPHMNLDDRIELLLTVFSVLTPREQIVLRCRFGLVKGRKEYTLAWLGERLNVSREAVRQIEVRAMKKLREAMYVQMQSA